MYNNILVFIFLYVCMYYSCIYRCLYMYTSHIYEMCTQICITANIITCFHVLISFENVHMGCKAGHNAFRLKHVVGSWLKHRFHVRLVSMGIRQRLGLKKHDAKSSPTDMVIKKLFKTGKLQATEINDLSTKMVAVGDKSNIVTKCVSSGGVKAPTRHMSRGVTRACASDTGTPEIYSTTCVFWDEKRGFKMTDEIYCLLPYETVDNLIREDGDISDYCSLPEGSPFQGN